MRTKEKTIRSIPWAFTGKTLKYLVYVLLPITIVHFLGKNAFNEYAVVKNFIKLLLMFGGFGVTQAVLKYIPNCVALKQRSKIKDVIIKGMNIQIIVWFAILFFTFIFRSILSEKYNMPQSYMIAASIIVLFNIIYTYFASVLTAFFDNKYLAIVDFFEGVVKIIIVVILVLLNFKILGVIVGTQVSFLILSVLLLLRIKNNVINIKEEPNNIASEEDFSYWRLLKFSTPFMLINVLTLITWKQSGVLFLGVFDKENVGMFDIAFTYSDMIINFIPLTLMPIWMAASSEKYSVDKANLKKTIKWHYNLLFLVSAPITVGGIMVMDKFIVLAFGQEYAPAGIVCQLLFFVFFISFFGAPLSLAIYVAEKSWLNLIIYIFYAAIKVILDYFCIKKWGFRGAIIPTAVVIAISPIVRYITAKIVIGEIEIPWKFIWKTCLCALPIALIFPLRYIHFFAETIPGIFVMVIIGIVFYGISARHFGLISGEIKEFIMISKLPFKEKIISVLSR